RERARCDGEHIIAAQPPQVVRVLLGERHVVVAQENRGHDVSVDREASDRESLGGNVTITRVPAPGSVSTRRLPPRSATNRRTIERPSPVPPALVVKKSS